MEYSHFEKRIMEAKRIVIIGWTYPKFTSPSNFKKLTDIQKLYDAVCGRTCKAVKLSQEEWDQRIAANVSVAALAEYHPGAPATKKCKVTERQEEEEEEEEVAPVWRTGDA